MKPRIYWGFKVGIKEGIILAALIPSLYYYLPYVLTMAFLFPFLFRIVVHCWEAIKCKRCKGSGKIMGFDPFLEETFPRKCKCYVCNGAGWRISDPSGNLQLIQNAPLEQAKKTKELDNLIQNYDEYLEQFNLTQAMNQEKLLDCHLDVMVSLQAEEKFIREQIIVHQLIESLAYRNLYHLFLMTLSQKVRIRLKDKQGANQEVFSDLVYQVKDLELSQKYHFQSSLNDLLIDCSYEINKDLFEELAQLKENIRDFSHLSVR